MKITQWIGTRFYWLGARLGYWTGKFKLGYETFSSHPLKWRDE